MKNQAMTGSEKARPVVIEASDLESRERALEAFHRGAPRSIRVRLDLLKARVKLNLHEILGLDPRDLIRAIGSPLCPDCYRELRYRSIIESIPESEGIILIVVPWSAFHRTMSIRGAAEIWGATRVVWNQILHLAGEVDPGVLIPTMASDCYGGVVVKSLSCAMVRTELEEEVRRTAESGGFPLSLVSIDQGILSQSVLIEGEWWCSFCETGCSIDGRSVEYGLIVDGERHPFMTTYQVLSESIGDLGAILREPGVSVETPISAQFEVFFNLIDGTGLASRKWLDSWEDLTHADRYIVRLIPLGLAHLSGVCAILEDVSLFGKNERKAVHRIINFLGPDSSVVWCEDGEINTDLRSEFNIQIKGIEEGQPDVTPSSILDCDFLPPAQGECLLDVLDIRSSLTQVFVTLPESRRLGLQVGDFMKPDGTSGRWSVEIEKQGYSFKRLLKTPIQDILASVALPYQILTYLSMLTEMGYGGLCLEQPLSTSCVKIFRLIPWLCAQPEFPVQILNPLTGCTPDEAAPFMSLLRVMHGQNKEIFLKTRQRWVRQYFGVNK